jgi:hypothetical protein
MNYTGADTVRISAEYERRTRKPPAGFYAWSKPSNLLLHEHALRGHSVVRLSRQQPGESPANPHGCGVAAREIRSLFAGCEIALASVLLAPPLGRLIAGSSWPLAELLHALPCFRTHYAGLIRKRRSADDDPRG